MDRKQSKYSTRRPSSKAKKRSFQGNRYTVENTTEYTSTSAKKLQNTEELEVNVDPSFNYCIIQFTTVFFTLQQLLKCADCNGEVKFSKNGQRGLGFKLSVKCECKETLILSSPLVDKAFEINRRLVFAMRMLGVGLQGINNFCGLMDLGQGIGNNIYYSIINNIKIAAEAVANIIFKKAVREEIEMNREEGHPANELSVSGDGSWIKNGLSSLLGVGSIIGKHTNKILDVIVKSHICQDCLSWTGEKDTVEYAAWYDDHKEHCDANHEGSAGKMEVDGIIEMFKRSEELYGVKYVNYIGDEDTKTFESLLDVKPYGDDYVVRKSECVLDVQNNHKSFNSCIWQFAPKHQVSGKSIIDVATYCAACTLNEDLAAILKIMEVMGITIGSQAEKIAQERNTWQIYKADRQNSKKGKMARKKAKTEEEEEYEFMEGILYGTN